MPIGRIAIAIAFVGTNQVELHVFKLPDGWRPEWKWEHHDI